MILLALEKDKIECSFSLKNQQCKKESCPFFRGQNEAKQSTQKENLFVIDFSSVTNV